MDTRPSEGSNRCSEESDGTKSQLTDWPQGQVVCGRSSIHVDECLHIENIPCTLRCGTKVPGIILWVTRVSLGLAQTCAEEPRIMCRQGCRAGWLRLKPSERKSRISAGTRLPQVLRQHRKQDGRDKLHLSVCNKKKKTLKNRQDGAEAPHLLQWDQRPPAVFIWLCLCSWEAGLVGGDSTGFLSASSRRRLDPCLTLWDQEAYPPFLKGLGTCPWPQLITAPRALSPLPSCCAHAYGMGKVPRNRKRGWDKIQNQIL